MGGATFFNSIGGRLGGLVAMALVAMLVVIGGWFYVFAQMKVGGPVYQKLADNYALAGDAEPPPLFIVESYLALSQAAAETDKQAIADLRRANADLRQSFEDRYKFWQGPQLDPQIRELLNGTVHDQAEAVFATAERDFFPALERGDGAAAANAFKDLTQSYQRHHAAVVDMIKLIDQAHADIEAEAAATAKTMELLVAAIVAIAIMAISVAGWAVRRSIVTPLKRIEGSVQALGSGDTSQAVPEQGRADELGPLARALEGWRGALIAGESARRDEYEKSARELRAMQETERRIEEFRGSVNSLLQNVNRAATSMGATAGALKDNAANGRLLAGEVTSASHNAASSVQTVAAAAEELSSTVREVGGQVRAAAETSAVAVQKTQDLRSIFGQMSKASASIAGVVGLISDITNKTNLLALNATIEAAGAGEAGRGFAVVANEVKSLANQTSAATGDIRNQVSAVQEAADEASRAIEEIAEAIRNVDVISAAIASAVVQQGTATDEIARSIVVASQGSDQVAASVEMVHKSTEITAGSAEDVGAVAGDLARLSESLSRNIESFLADIDSGARKAA